MKKTLTIFGLLLTTLMFGQTSEIELNYANGGYIELQKMGIDAKEGYVIEKTGLEFEDKFGIGGDGAYFVLKLFRTEDKSIAAIMIAQEGEKPVLTVMDPKTRGKKQYVSKERIIGSSFDATDAMAKMLQTIYWPE